MVHTVYQEDKVREFHQEVLYLGKFRVLMTVVYAWHDPSPNQSTSVISENQSRLLSDEQKLQTAKQNH